MKLKLYSTQGEKLLISLREYPGAGDRGGSDEDVSNFVLLFKDIREAFDRSGQKFGLTFTIPSSFWYLRWFDMPGLLKYADWANLVRILP